MKILGISCYYHDAAATILIDGEIIAAATEERFSRKKHDSDFPKKAIKFCLQKAQVDPNEIDYVVFYEKPFLKFERITLSALSTAPKGRSAFVSAYKTWLKSKLWIKASISKELRIESEKILFSSHHVSHAAAAYYTSPYQSAAILTVDGVGEWTTTAWGVGKDNKITLKKEIKFPHSLGLLYSVFTQFLGFRINNGEFKVMGLSPYGRPKYKERIEKLIEQNDDGSFKLNMSYFNYHLSESVSYNQKFINLLGMKPNPKGKSDQVIQKYADLAASVQEVLEDKLLVIAKEIKKETGENNLCYGGGVALNGVANWKIFENAGFKNIYIHPEAGDAGGALGAALYLYHHVLGNKTRKKLSTPYLGASNSDDDIAEFINQKNLKAVKLSDKDLIEKVSGMIARKKVIGWVRGDFEWGPRALGNRSILADPRSKKMKDLVNAKIKFREPFRPFAPVCCIEDGKKYFDVGNNYNQQPLQYMLAVVQVKKEWREKLGAVTHVNGSARPQFVKRAVNPVYYDLIKAFGKMTGVSVILNTSFNLKGEPIVNTCEDAYKTFMNSGLDALVLGNFLILK